MEDKSVCVHCKADLTDVGWGDPCPSCGRDDGKTWTDEEAWECLTKLDTVSFRQPHPEHPTVADLWAQSLRRIERVGKMCAAGSVTDRDDLKDAVDAMFVGIFHLFDWLFEDLTVEPKITDRQVKAHFDSSLHLKICADYTNSYKHLMRKTGGYARIDLIDRPAHSPMTVTVAYWERDKPESKKSIEVLELAENAMTEWRIFLDKWQNGQL